MSLKAAGNIYASIWTEMLHGGMAHGKMYAATPVHTVAEMEKKVMDKRKNGLYLAYGSNLNLEQMRLRCPAAKIVGTSILNGWHLTFRGGENMAVATVEQKKDGKVPVLVWKLTPADERALDYYEGFPYLYQKEQLRVLVEGKRMTAMIYVMNASIRPYGTPSKSYLNTIREGYASAGFDTEILNCAVSCTERYLSGKVDTDSQTASTNREQRKRRREEF